PKKIRMTMKMLALLAFLFSTSLNPLGAQVLYETDFSEFPVGPGQWAGSEGWVGTAAGEGVSGIDAGEISGQGPNAFLGFERPSAEVVSVYRVIDSSAWDVEVLRFEALIGISTSLTGGDDLFAIGFHDDNGTFLASLQFNTDPLDFGLWRDDGVESIDTGEVFFSDYLHVLSIDINMKENTWSVDLDGIGVFRDEVFTRMVADRSVIFGGLGVEWEILNPSNPGDNWLYLDDLEVRVVSGEPTTPFEVEALEWTSTGALRLIWSAPSEGDYVLEQSEDGHLWETHPDGVLEVVTAGRQVFEATEPASADRQLLRFRRLEEGE
ncbi:MAG: hypothetical protein AAF514_12055, partial [Verrucomicrobiota bacterium]